MAAAPTALGRASEGPDALRRFHIGIGPQPTAEPTSSVFLLIQDLNVCVINAGHQQGETVIGAGPKRTGPNHFGVLISRWRW
jgi:hypothetical protein